MGSSGQSQEENRNAAYCVVRILPGVPLSVPMHESVYVLAKEWDCKAVSLFITTAF